MLVVLDLDRLGRLASDLIKLIDELAEKDIGFKAINSPMDTTTPAGRAFLQIQAAFAEMEGTTRTISQESRDRVRAQVSETAQSIAALYGGTAEIEWTDFAAALARNRFDDLQQGALHARLL